MPKLLVIDDEESVRYSFRYVYEDQDVQVLTAATAAEGWQQLEEHDPDAVVLDLQLPDRSGLELFADIQAVDPKRPVIFITAHGTADTAIEAMKQGAFDYLVKPVDLETLTRLLDRAFTASRLMHTPAVLPAELDGDQIIARSRAMQEMCKLVGRVAPQDVNVLILGESGAGKELVARALYQHSSRADKPFLAINCAAIPETLLESELFGHERGAFTGAERRRIGKFEQCDGGTLFLDEIGDMKPALQAKMLRVLQEQSFERVGGNDTVHTRVRILAATNQNLEKLVAEERFRADLYYRLKAVTIAVPPLRERPEDVAELAHYFLFRFNRELGLNLLDLAPETLELLHGYSWPGNVRELQGVIQQAMLNASGTLLLPEFLSPHLRQHPIPVSPVAAPVTLPGLQTLVASLLETDEAGLYARVLEAMERQLLSQILQHTHGHQTRASEILGISRATMRHKLRALGLTFDKILTESPASEEPGATGHS
ncbi:MAG TPA: sigma-54 dependent transcriptional regulator [Gemmataceae bacterium]|jgi:two-component system nitrogen regulation response regulator GlnG